MSFGMQFAVYYGIGRQKPKKRRHSMRAPTSTKTEEYRADLEALAAMQQSCVRGEMAEDVYNAHREKEAARLIALGVLPGRLSAKVIDGNPTL
jgi:tartrate dehydratase beta subunit/fumarate hydratase class I family protein